jgi:hypothetical protein
MYYSLRDCFVCISPLYDSGGKRLQAALLLAAIAQIPGRGEKLLPVVLFQGRTKEGVSRADRVRAYVSGCDYSLPGRLSQGHSGRGVQLAFCIRIGEDCRFIRKSKQMNAYIHRKKKQETEYETDMDEPLVQHSVEYHRSDEAGQS